MNQNGIKKEISALLEVINGQWNEITMKEGKSPQIEIDILLSNIRGFYEKIKSLEISGVNDVFVPEPVMEIIEEKENIFVPEVKETVEEKKIIIPEIIKFIEPEIKVEETPVVTEVPQAPPPPVEEKIIMEEVKKAEEPVSPKVFVEEKKSKNAKGSIDLFSGHATVADKFKEEKKSLNEKLSASHSDKSIAAKLQNNPIKDIKAAIGINEKFKFINELFEGNLQKYSENIEKLNGFGGAEEAAAFMQVLKSEYSWKEDDEVYIELNDLVTRRYL